MSSYTHRKRALLLVQSALPPLTSPLGLGVFTKPSFVSLQSLLTFHLPLPLSSSVNAGSGFPQCVGSPESSSLASSHLCSLLCLYTVQPARVDLKTKLCSMLFGPGSLGVVQWSQGNICGLTKCRTLSLTAALMDGLPSRGAEQSVMRWIITAFWLNLKLMWCKWWNIKEVISEGKWDSVYKKHLGENDLRMKITYVPIPRPPNLILKKVSFKWCPREC